MSSAVLSSAAYRAAWEHLDLGAMPIVLHVQEPASWDDLAEHTEGSELDPWLAGAFKLLANPPRSIDMRLGFGSTSVRALAASAGTGGVLAVLTRDTLDVRELDHDDLAAELVRLLPAEPDLRARFGAATIDETGRRHRAVDVVDWASDEDVTREVLETRIHALLDTIRATERH